MKRLVLTLLAILCGGLTLAADAPAPAPVPIGFTPDDVRHHLGHVIDWYHRLSGLERNPALTDDLVTRERLRQTMLTEVRLAFGFGRAAAPLVSEPPKEAADAGEEAAPEETDSARYERIASGMTSRAADLQARITQLDVRLRTASAAERPVLVAQRAQLAAALNLTGEVQDTVRGLQQFAARSNSSASGEKGLLGDISDMERTVPEARLAPGPALRGTSTQAASDAAGGPVAAVPAATTALRTDSAGLISLGKEWLGLRAALRQHLHFIGATDELSEALDKISSNLTSQVRALLRSAPSAVTTTNTSELSAARAAIESATVRFKELSTLLVPLGEESITLDSAHSILDERRAALDSRAAVVARQLLLRAGLLLASIALIIVLAAVWRRATFRYLHDARRRQQFLSLRRIAMVIAFSAVVFMAFISEIGSLATYIGFLTAGIAVALQNVILAVVAYFFLIGRYGVRVGDRITMAGVTGRVAEIGLVRIYLKELGGVDLHPTGRMIVLSNAVVFQPSALFKQIPGVHYTWHIVTLLLAPTADLQLARTRLQATAEKVYATYSDSIEKQLRAARHLVDFDSGTPSPELTAQFSERGLEISVRYPVEPEQAAQVDQEMTRALRDALDEEPRLPIAEPDAPRAKPG
ncbi:MAG TPA: mechanosensitive ion channel family protein [Steroidobacteraceae bacterium]|nr:mechanosensitive ion channel family protein [Steroidobacteraceae bacterium]